MTVGSFKIASGGVNWSRGRGKGKVTIMLDFRTIERWAKRTRQDEKQLFARSYAAACKGLKDKFYSVVRHAGGVEGVPKFKDFEDFTKELRARRGRNAPMGGILAEKSSVYANKRNGWQYIGWADYLEEASIRFEDGGNAKDDEHFANPNNRHWWHREGVRYIPPTYAHNPRRVLPEPFGGYVRKHLNEWANGAFVKALARLMVVNEGMAK